MSDDAAGGAGDKSYTQDELESAIAEANQKLEANRDKVLAELKQAKDQLRGFDGVDPEEHRQLQAQVAELQQQQKADKAGISSEQLAKMRSEIEADLVKRYSAMDAGKLADAIPAVRQLADDNRALRLDSVVKAEMGKAGVRSERIDALFKLTADRFDLTNDGQPMLRDQPGVPVEKFVAEDLKAEYPELYNGSGSSGGGASKSNAGGGGSVRSIAADDSAGFLANLEGIADGSVAVV